VLGIWRVPWPHTASTIRQLQPGSVYIYIQVYYRNCDTTAAFIGNVLQYVYAQAEVISLPQLVRNPPVSVLLPSRCHVKGRPHSLIRAMSKTSLTPKGNLHRRSDSRRLAKEKLRSMIPTSMKRILHKRGKRCCRLDTGNLTSWTSTLRISLMVAS